MSQRRGSLGELHVDTIAGDRHLRKIGQQIDEQDLLRQQRQKRQEQRCARHAEHVSEIRAGGDEHVLERIGKGAPPLAHAIDQHFEVVLEQDEIGGLTRNIDRALDRQAHVRRVQGRHVVDSVADVADDVTGLLESENQALLLARFDFGEDIDCRSPVA